MLERWREPSEAAGVAPPARGVAFCDEELRSKFLKSWLFMVAAESWVGAKREGSRRCHFARSRRRTGTH